jgi:peptide/nickel transport system permease protein
VKKKRKSAEQSSGGEDLEIEVASQAKLVWWRFRKHKLANISLVILAFVYLAAIFAEFIAPYDANFYNADYVYVPPQRVRFFDTSGGGLKFGPYVYDFTTQIDKESYRRTAVMNMEKKVSLRFFGMGDKYKLWNLFPCERHLLVAAKPGEYFFLLGTDRLGRDNLSRVIYSTRVSMSIGLIGVLMSLVFGIVLGGISGYYGGVLDNVIQRVIEFIRSIPTIPLWMGLAAAIPVSWPPLQVYFTITLILSLIGWTGLARVVRGRFLALRTEDFVLAARLDGCREMRIILRQMVPSFLSHIIASITLAIPSMILSETALSFIGIGLRPPVVSWGIMLQEAQNIRSVAYFPWLLFIPAVPILISVLAFNFLGDGLRDAADPYNT